jgi:hypothetical protein
MSTVPVAGRADQREGGACGKQSVLCACLRQLPVVLRRLRPARRRQQTMRPSRQKGSPPRAGKPRKAVLVFTAGSLAGGARLYPRIATTTPQSFTVASPQRRDTCPKVPAHDERVRAATSPDPPGSSW